MNGGPSIIRRSNFEKSNIELTNSIRSNLYAAQQEAIPQSNGLSQFHNESGVKCAQSQALTDYKHWTTRAEDHLYVPTIDFTQSGLAEERSQYDITAKLFFLPTTRASAKWNHAKEAMSLVSRELHVQSIDLLIVSFPGVTLDADDDEEDEIDGEGNGEEDLDAMIETWKTLECLHKQGMVAQVGIAEFGSDRLKKFLPRTEVRPSVDQINVRDCCVVPKDLILFAKKENIQLLTHSDCTNILPGGTVRDLLGAGEQGAGVLAGSLGNSSGLKGDVQPQWVIKYTAVVRDRGVVENKGYFAMAEVNDET
ncbi:hypothetical protein MMC09_006292 [Bachmanniomyces sp. S44760]|nr:hypothetical protein [Bachmanniomyces sp. S44760]